MGLQTKIRQQPCSRAASPVSVRASRGDIARLDTGGFSRAATDCWGGAEPGRAVQYRMEATPFPLLQHSDAGHHPITHLSSLERENFLERLSEADFKISEMRKREKLYQAEIDLARKAGYIPTFSFSDDNNNEDLENIIDISEFVDVGEPGSEKFKVIEAIIKLSKQLQKAKVGKKKFFYFLIFF